MNAAVSFRPQRIVPQVVTVGHWRRMMSPTLETAIPAASIEELDPPLGATDTLVTRIGAVRERWAQLTFFLCDPQSWR